MKELKQEAWLPYEDILTRFDWAAVFGNTKPVEMELGAGDGGFILEFARLHPERNFVAVERLKGRVEKIAKRAARQELANLKALRLQSEYVLRWMTPPESLSVIHIMFPDPWPKRRHHKNRLIQSDFLASARRALQPGGVIRFTMDHEEYFAWAQEVWRGCPGWKALGGWDASEDPKSDFERQFEEEGRNFQRCLWQKT